MSYPNIGINLIGSFATSDEIKKNKSVIENIINTISAHICQKDKENRLILIDAVKEVIKKSYPDYEKICTEPSTKADKSCDDNSKMFFNDKRIADIIDSIRNNTLYRRMCKFKYRALNGYLEYDLLSKVLYSIRTNPISNFIFPYFGYNLMRHVDEHLNNKLVGGYTTEDKGEYGLGSRLVYGRKEPIKFVDFDEFVEQYENYYTIQNGLMHVKSCHVNDGKRTCSQKTFKMGLSIDPDRQHEQILNKPVDGTDSESEVNVMTRGSNQTLDEAYHAVLRSRNIQNLEDAIEKTEQLLDYIKYFVLPLKTLEKSERVNSNI